jgi:plasmid stabilization system protein ParE
LNLRYTPTALAELDDILGYIAERSPQGARSVQARIQAITILLQQHPLSGQLIVVRSSAFIHRHSRLAIA